MGILLSIAIFILVLSVLIFFHELGHFLAAKACGIYVDRFSLGMPPRILGIQLGETDYCLGALPIGGYVKMAGQEDAPLSEEERDQTYGHVPPDRWFNKKPIWQRFIVVVAGPLMNLVLAVLLYAILAALGQEVPEWDTSGRIGKVEPGSAAAEAPLYPETPGAPLESYKGEPATRGWQTGDLVLAIDGKPVESFTDLALSALLGGEGQEQRVLLERTEPDGAKKRYVSLISPRITEEDGQPQFGIGRFQTTLIAGTSPGMPAAAQDLREGDVIERANGKIIDESTFVELVEDTPEGQPIQLTIRRNEQAFDLSIQPATIGRFKDMTFGLESGEKADRDRLPPAVLETTEDFQKATGLQRKDVITAVNGEPTTVAKFDELIRRSPGATLNITVQRPAILFGLLQKAEEKQLQVQVDSVRALGVELRSRMIHVTTPAARILPEALNQSYNALALVMRTLKALATQSVSPKNLGGPLMIASATTQAAEQGFGWLLRITAFISINLCVFNLLPLPVLDGGLLLVNVIEGLRRKPLSAKFLERYQMVGLFFIIFLMVFVTYHDLRRWFEGMMP